MAGFREGNEPIGFSGASEHGKTGNPYGEGEERENTSNNLSGLR